MTDSRTSKSLVDRLWEYGTVVGQPLSAQDRVCHEAAAEIERLQRENDELQETFAAQPVREFIAETRKSCMHGGNQHCPYFKPGHPCCDRGASASEGESQ